MDGFQQEGVNFNAVAKNSHTLEPTSLAMQSRRLKILRTALGQTLGGMAEMIGYSTPQSWANFEDGRPFGPQLAIRLCQRTGVDMPWIYYGREDGLPLLLLKKIKAAEKGELQPPKRGRRPRNPAAG
jgi:hypothetical protein